MLTPQSTGQDIATRYAARHAQLKAKQQEFKEVVNILAEHGISPDPANFDLYKYATKQVLAAKKSDRSHEVEMNLATMLHRYGSPVVAGGYGSMHQW